MKITNIKQQVKRADRYSIFVDGKYAFSLGESALLEQKLSVGQELGKEQLKAFKQLSADDKVYNQALRYIALRPRSVWEMEFYLRRKKVEELAAERILSKLTKFSLLDDLAFARSWVENRRLLKPVSRRRLTQELRQKRISDEVIEQVLEADDTDELETLRQLVAKKKQQSKYRDDKLKFTQYLARQGFGYGDIKQVLEED